MRMSVEEVLAAVSLIELAEADEYLLKACCTHEAGHSILCSSFLLDAKCYVAGPGVAACWHRLGNAWQRSVIGWGGIIAETLMQCRYPSERTWPGLELNPANATQWIYSYLYDGPLTALQRANPSDYNSISAHPERAASGRDAFNVLHARRDILEYKVESLLKEFRRTFGRAQARNDRLADANELLTAMAGGL
jgi:hypothetical protein